MASGQDFARNVADAQTTATLGADVFVGLELLGVSVGIEAGLELTFLDTRGWLGELLVLRVELWSGLELTDGLGLVRSCSLTPLTEGEQGHDGGHLLRCDLELFGDASILAVRVSGEWTLTGTSARAH